MRLLKRLLHRLLILGLGILSVWLIAFVFRFTDQRLPTILALALTYGIAAYIVLPRAVRMGLKILQRKRVPRFTVPATDCRVIPSISYLLEPSNSCAPRL